MFIEFVIDFNGSIQLLQSKHESNFKIGYQRIYGVKLTLILLVLDKLFAKQMDENASHAN